MAAIWRIFAGQWVLSPLEHIKRFSMHFNRLFIFALQCFRLRAIFLERIIAIKRGTIVAYWGLVIQPPFCQMRWISILAFWVPQRALSLGEQNSEYQATWPVPLKLSCYLLVWWTTLLNFLDWCMIQLPFQLHSVHELKETLFCPLHQAGEVFWSGSDDM